MTACDAASSYAMAKVVPANNAREAASFLTDVVAAEVRKAGWKLWRVLTDGGSEFKAEFDQACRELNVKHTRTQPRHVWTNGFVERLQGTILHEHWRIAFRRRYFQRRHQLQASLLSFVEFYNFEQPHQGYRTKGRTAAEIFWGPSENNVTRRSNVLTPLRYWTVPRTLVRLTDAGREAVATYRTEMDRILASL